MGRWGDGETHRTHQMGRWGDEEMRRWGDAPDAQDTDYPEYL